MPRTSPRLAGPSPVEGASEGKTPGSDDAHPSIHGPGSAEQREARRQRRSAIAAAASEGGGGRGAALRAIGDGQGHKTPGGAARATGRTAGEAAAVTPEGDELEQCSGKSRAGEPEQCPEEDAGTPVGQEGRSSDERGSSEEEVAEPSNRDIVLSLHDERYKEVMWRHYRMLGKARDGDREAELASDILALFKRGVGEEGRFLKRKACGKRVKVGDDAALAKIRDDIVRRVRNYDEWSGEANEKRARRPRARGSPRKRESRATLLEVAAPSSNGPIRRLRSNTELPPSSSNEDSSSEDSSSESDSSDEELSPYERLRKENIKRNNKRLRSLGLLDKPAADGGSASKRSSALTRLLTSANSAKDGAKSASKAQKKPPAEPLPRRTLPTRTGLAHRGNENSSEGSNEEGEVVASLDEAAEAGCRKCKELDSGVKSKKGHDDGCPRKRGYVPVPAKRSNDESEGEPCPDLGPGWIKKVVARKDSNKKDSFYFSPDGDKFKSKAQATKFLECKKESNDESDGEPCPDLGPGWVKKVVARKGSNTKDSYYFSPDGDKFKSKAQATKFLEGKKGGRNVGESTQEDAERNAWSAKEDKELLKQVSLHGEGNWKVIHDNSRILSSWCAQAGVKKGSDALGSRWRRRIKHSAPAQDDESLASSASDESSESEEGGDEEECSAGADRYGWSAKQDKELLKRVCLHGEGNWKVILDNSPILISWCEQAGVKKGSKALGKRWWRRERKAWSDKEDKELLKQVSLHGEGNWRVILDNSLILSGWCAQAGVKKGSNALSSRWWGRIKHSAPAQDDESFASSASDESSEIERDVESNEGSDEEGTTGERKAWSAKEDKELLKQVSLHGEGKWKVILDNSRILSSWCERASVKKRSDALWSRWRRRIKHCAAAQDDDSLESSESESDVCSLVGGDEGSVVSSMSNDEIVHEKAKQSTTPPRVDWQHVPEMTRQSLLKSICDGRPSSNNITVVQLSKRGDTDKDSLQKFFLLVPDIVAKGMHEGSAVPADSLFVMFQIDSIVSVYDEHYGTQLGDDNTSWDIYAQATNDEDGATAVTYWAVDDEGTEVARLDVPTQGGVYKWYALLCHQEQDRVDREEQDRIDHERLVEDRNETLSPDPLAVVSLCDKATLPADLHFALEQMRIVPSKGLACKHCSNEGGSGFHYTPASRDALSSDIGAVVDHVKECNDCPPEIREELASLLTKKGRSSSRVRSSTFFDQIWGRLDIPDPLDSSDEDTESEDEHYSSEEEEVAEPSGDIVLSLHDERYKEVMWRHYRKLGKTSDAAQTKEASEDVFALFKQGMEDEGKFFKRDASGADVEVDDDAALAKIRADIGRRMKNYDTWSGGTRTSRGKRKAPSTTPASSAENSNQSKRSKRAPTVEPPQKAPESVAEEESLLVPTHSTIQGDHGVVDCWTRIVPAGNPLRETLQPLLSSAHEFAIGRVRDPNPFLLAHGRFLTDIERAFCSRDSPSSSLIAASDVASVLIAAFKNGRRALLEALQNKRAERDPAAERLKGALTCGPVASPSDAPPEVATTNENSALICVPVASGADGQGTENASSHCMMCS